MVGADQLLARKTLYFDFSARVRAYKVGVHYENNKNRQVCKKGLSIFPFLVYSYSIVAIGFGLRS